MAISVAFGDNAGHGHQHRLRMQLKKKKKTQTWSLVMVGCYHGPTWHCRLPRSYVVVVGAASKMPVCPQVTIIYPGCGRVSDTDKVLGHSLRLDNTVAPDDCMGLCVCVAPVAA